MTVPRSTGRNQARRNRDHRTVLEYMESARGLLLAAAAFLAAVTGLVVALFGRG